MKKIFVLLLALVIGISMVACGGSSNNAEEKERSAKPEEKKELELLDSGYSVTGSGDSLYIYYAVKLKNPTTKFISEFATIRVTARDENGNVLDTYNQTLSKIYPGETTGWAGMGPSTQVQPTTVDIELVSSDWAPAPSEIPSPLTAVSTTLVTDEYGFSKVSGEVENPNGKAFNSVGVAVLFKDANGNLIGGDITFVDNVVASGKTPFSIDVLSEEFVTDSYEVFATEWL